jgi:hypothetical protein
MNNLKSATALAQATADREGRAMAILNLNCYSPLYVVRDYDPRHDTARGFICKVEPKAC